MTTWARYPVNDLLAERLGDAESEGKIDNVHNLSFYIIERGLVFVCVFYRSLNKNGTGSKTVYITRVINVNSSDTCETKKEAEKGGWW